MFDRSAYLLWIVMFLLGSIPFGFLVARVFHVSNLTVRGSGNIGATNVSRVLGFWPAGFLTLLMDVAKGAVPLWLVQREWIQQGLIQWSGSPESAFNSVEVWFGAFFAVLGHCYSPWLRFRGGKGVATGFGVLLILSPISAAFGIMGFGIAFLKSRMGSLASISGLAVAAVAHLVLEPMDAHLWAGAALILVILIRHEGNLDAILQDREKTF
ncbi:glycerol-3-phosphate acyltransferase [Bdellovibrionota bacterium FG-1]